MKTVKVCSLIAEITVYVYAAVCLCLALIAQFASDALGEFSASLEWAGLLGWINLAITAIIGGAVFIIGRTEQKNDVKRTHLRALLYFIGIAAIMAVAFVTLVVFLIAVSFADKEFGFLDKAGFPIAYFPCVIIAVSAVVACWAKTAAIKQKMDDARFFDPFLKRKKTISVVGSIIYTTLGVASIAVWVVMTVLVFTA